MVKPREVYESAARKTFENALSQLFRTEFGFLGGPAVIELIVNRIKLLCDEYYPPSDNFQFGEMLWFGVAEDIKRGQIRMEDLKLVPVKLPIVTPEDFRMYAKGVSQKDIKKTVMARLFKSAQKQGGILAEVDIAAMMHMSLKNVSKYFVEYEKETGELLPSRGVVHDVGGTVTHKAQIVAEHLENKQTPDVAKKYDHTVKAADRYINGYERVKTAYKNGIPLNKLPFVTNMSRRLVSEYLSLLEKFEHENIENDEYLNEKRNSK
jgi:hypothetical protein